MYPGGYLEANETNLLKVLPYILEKHGKKKATTIAGRCGNKSLKLTNEEQYLRM